MNYKNEIKKKLETLYAIDKESRPVNYKELIDALLLIVMADDHDVNEILYRRTKDTVERGHVWLYNMLDELIENRQYDLF